MGGKYYKESSIIKQKKMNIYLMENEIKSIEFSEYITIIKLKLGKIKNIFLYFM